jgi:hypothetical protein
VWTRRWKKADSHGSENKSIQPWRHRARAVLDTNQESIKKNKRDSQMDQFQVKFRFLLSVGLESNPVAFMSEKTPWTPSFQPEFQVKDALLTPN